MPNIAAVLKDEITRLARKEVRAETDRIKKASGAHRSEIAALKRRVHDLEMQLKSVLKVSQRERARAAPADPGHEPNNRYSAKGLISLRKRLGLSASDLGLLVGASGQSIYNWEQGSARPRGESIARLAELRSIGKREAVRRIDAARAAS